MTSHADSPWNKGSGELGNGLLRSSSLPPKFVKTSWFPSPRDGKIPLRITRATLTILWTALLRSRSDRFKKWFPMKFTTNHSFHAGLHGEFDLMSKVQLSRKNKQTNKQERKKRTSFNRRALAVQWNIIVTPGYSCWPGKGKKKKQQELQADANGVHLSHESSSSGELSGSI